MDAKATPGADLQSLLRAQQQAFAAQSFPPAALRLEWLERMRRLVQDNEEAIADAICADFGNRSRQETALAEVFFVLASIAHARKHLGRWMKRRRVRTSLHSLPGSSWIMAQPLGVVGIVSPWNYPAQLALAPAVAALAAGNRVMIKPSETTPRCSQLLAQLVAQRFGADECTVVTGDADVGRDFVRLPFNHLFFTGSTEVGRKVALAAAANLTPVTLELGGKSPAIVDDSADLAESARRIAVGKLFNAGQTCIAPDYVLVPHERQQGFADAYARSVAELYPTLEDNPDYTSVVDDRHYARLQGLLQDAQLAGARVQAINPGGQSDDAATRKMRPALVLGATGAMRVMREEIFGPLLPVIGYRSLDEAIAFVNERPRPLALYWFGRDAAHRDQVLRRTISGGVTVNDALLHIAQENLPFGGVGDSGIGAYHGDYGFNLFSKEKPVFVQSRLAGTWMLRPPYGKMAASVMRTLRRLV